MTLMIFLLRNLSAVTKPVNGFDSLPPILETHPGADIARIKYYRNIIVHRNNDIISKSDFSNVWTDLSQVQ